MQDGAAQAGRIAALLAVVGCSPPEEGPTAPARWANVGRVCLPWAAATSLPRAARDSLPPLAAEDTLRDTQAQWAQLARRLPGWAGEGFVGGRETVFLTDLRRAPDVEARFRLRPGAVQFRQVRWDYGQLYDWYRYLGPRLRERELVTSSVDGARNRLEFGVVSDAARRRLEAELAALRVPCYLVAVRVTWSHPRAADAPAGRPAGVALDSLTVPEPRGRLRATAAGASILNPRVTVSGQQYGASVPVTVTAR